MTRAIEEDGILSPISGGVCKESIQAGLKSAHDALKLVKSIVAPKL